MYGRNTWRVLAITVGLAGLSLPPPAAAVNKPTGDSAGVATALEDPRRPEIARREAFAKGLALYLDSDYVGAFQIWMNLAENGHFVAQRNLELMYELGVGVRKNKPIALKWRTLWEQTLVDLRFSACVFINVAKWRDEERVAELERCKALAAKGDLFAPRHLARYYGERQNPDFDLGEAFYWYAITARAGWLDDAATVQAVLAGENPRRFEGLTRNQLAKAKARLVVAELPRNPYLVIGSSTGSPASDSAGGQGKARGGSAGPSGAGGGGERRASGTGIVVAQPARILTNAHVVQRCARISVIAEGAAKPARVEAVDAKVDLALVSVETRFERVASLRAPVNTRTGEDIVVVGFPLQSVLSHEPIVTAGIVSALAGFKGDPTQIQISAPVQPGNSGGPVYDLNGNVIAVVVAGLTTLRAKRGNQTVTPQNVNFAINVAEAQKFLDQHHVQWRKRAFDKDKRIAAADIAEQARKTTVLIECVLR